MGKEWDILEIGPTTEVAVIKKAYAKHLKIYRPDDDPQGFQLLREAYDSALQYAKFHRYDTENEIYEDNIEGDNNQCVQTQDNNDDEGDVTTNYVNLDKVNNQNNYINQECIYEDEYENLEEYNDLNASYKRLPPDTFINSSLEVDENSGQLIDNFFEKVQNLYNNFYQRIEEKNWEELLKEEVFWQLDLVEQVKYRMLNFLIENYFIPRNVWRMFNKIFHWDEQEVFLHQHFPFEFVDYLFLQLGDERVLRYCYFDKNVEMDYEEYLSCRENAFMALRRTDLEEAEHYLSKAYKMYKKDPDLLCMMGDYYYKKNQIRKRYRYFDEANRINPKDISIDLYQAHIMLENKDYSETIKKCKTIQKNDSNKYEAEILIGRCFFYMGKWHKAAKIFLKCLKKDPLNLQSKKYLFRLADKIQDVIKEQPLNVVLRKDYKEIGIMLGETSMLKDIRMEPRDIITILRNNTKLFLYLFFILMAIGMLFRYARALAIICLFIAFFRAESKNNK